MQRQLDRIFASMSFEDEDIDHDLMAQVMERMRSDLSVEVGDQQDTSVETSSPIENAPQPPSRNITDNNSAALPLVPENTSKATIRVSLLRFDGVKETQDFSIEVNKNDSASTFLAGVLETKELMNGISRMDRGSPDSVSAGTLIQPMWKSMREVISEIENDPEVSDKITIHWYPCPPLTNTQYHGGGHTGITPNWVRVITVTRRSVFVLFYEDQTTLLSMKRTIEALTGVAVEWQRLLFGSRLLQGEQQQSLESVSGNQLENEENILVSRFGIKGGMNIFLTHRIEGMEYGGDGAGLP